MTDKIEYRCKLVEGPLNEKVIIQDKVELALNVSCNLFHHLSTLETDLLVTDKPGTIKENTIQYFRYVLSRKAGTELEYIYDEDGTKEPREL